MLGRSQRKNKKSEEWGTEWWLCHVPSAWTLCVFLCVCLHVQFISHLCCNVQYLYLIPTSPVESLPAAQSRFLSTTCSRVGGCDEAGNMSTSSCRFSICRLCQEEPCVSVFWGKLESKNVGFPVLHTSWWGGFATWRRSNLTKNSPSLHFKSECLVDATVWSLTLLRSQFYHLLHRREAALSAQQQTMFPSLNV